MWNIHIALAAISMMLALMWGRWWAGGFLGLRIWNTFFSCFDFIEKFKCKIVDWKSSSKYKTHESGDQLKITGSIWYLEIWYNNCFITAWCSNLILENEYILKNSSDLSIFFSIEDYKTHKPCTLFKKNPICRCISPQKHTKFNFLLQFRQRIEIKFLIKF